LSDALASFAHRMLRTDGCGVLNHSIPDKS
jgi:hypothetical protein